ncbi:GNAT family N-acetyltransferase [Phyllobacterium meliloti]|uniref:GNAT family N-acetyltransferase n=1 Tax=Phyllobacterium meliloti TaxID=555317 RepID=UPI000DDFDF5B|nr:GNAT family N-acetyltransferase [Phyllobacterium sp. T1293]UGX84796.1 GNAT family N-acetyltransferase [Phyllobacterium sp. T1293]
MTNIPVLETRRLILKPLELSDANAVQKNFPQWEVVKYLNVAVPWPYPEDGALTYIRDIALPGIAAGSQWHWSIRRKTAPDDLIGLISLTDGEEDNRGFWLAPAWQGQGLMSEACNRVTDYWFDTLGKMVLRVPKAIANTASRRISKRSGMRVIKTVERDYVSGRHPAEVWEITAEEWRSYRLNGE